MNENRLPVVYLHDMRRCGVVTLLLVAACAGPSTATPSTDTSSATSATSLPFSTTTSTTTPPWVNPDESPSQLVKVDPVSLDPLPGFDPIVIANGWGYSSPNGRWLVLEVWPTEWTRERVMIDVEGWEAKEIDYAFALIGVDDQGAVYGEQAMGRGNIIHRLSAGSDEWERLIDLDYPGYWLWTPMLVGGRLVGLYVGERPVLMVTELETGHRIETPVEGALVEATVVATLPDGSEVFESYMPGMVVGDERVLIVHAHEDVVTEVDLATGMAEKHQLTIETSIVDRFLAWLVPPAVAKGPSAGVTRHAAFSQDGATLYLSGYRDEVTVDSDGVTHETTTPMGVDVIDTETWTVTETIDLPVATVTLTPDGSTLLGSGYTGGGSSSDGYRFSGSGTYAFSTSDLDFSFIDQGFDWDTVVQFSRDGDHAYLSGWDHTGIEVLDLRSGEIVSRQTGEITLYGAAGVLSRWVGP